MFSMYHSPIILRILQNLLLPDYFESVKLLVSIRNFNLYVKLLVYTLSQISNTQSGGYSYSMVYFIKPACSAKKKRVLHFICYFFLSY